MILTFTKGRETKNAWRFEEDGKTDDHVVKTIYIQKTALEKLDDPDTDTIEVEIRSKAS